MAGLFQVLWGNEAGEFAAAEVLKGTDDQPLIIPATEETMIRNICTRPTAADIDGDGFFDLVVGNFEGTFFVFSGADKGKFAPTPSQLMADEKPIAVDCHSDPFLVDWDQDGDFDLISGSSSGGVSISLNDGTAKKPAFTEMKTMVHAVKESDSKTIFGDSHISGPQTATRVWVDDLNGDNKLDLIVGDSLNLSFPAVGLTEVEVADKLKEFEKKQTEVMLKLTAAQQSLAAAQLAATEKQVEEKNASDPSDSSSVSDRKKVQDENVQDEVSVESDQPEAEDLVDAVAAATKEFQSVMDEYQELSSEREKIVRDEMTGSVWVYFQK